MSGLRAFARLHGHDGSAGRVSTTCSIFYLGDESRTRPGLLRADARSSFDGIRRAERSRYAPIASRTPSYEATVTASWPHTEFPQLAARVEVPVHFTAAEHERVWRGDPEALDDIAASFTAAPRVELHTQPDAGHNLALGYAAASYHSTVLSFVQECIDDRAADRISATTK